MPFFIPQDSFFMRLFMPMFISPRLTKTQTQTQIRTLGIQITTYQLVFRCFIGTLFPNVFPRPIVDCRPVVRDTHSGGYEAPVGLS